MCATRDDTPKPFWHHTRNSQLQFLQTGPIVLDETLHGILELQCVEFLYVGKLFACVQELEFLQPPNMIQVLDANAAAVPLQNLDVWKISENGVITWIDFWTEI